MSVTIKRKTVQFNPDPKRVITRFFWPGDDERARIIIKQVLALSGEKRTQLFSQILRGFSTRHRNITKIFDQNFKSVEHLLAEMDIAVESLSKETQYVIGAYFTKEFSIESAAFFNPSIVEDPYQGNIRKGQKRVILSFRATGEGHVSSIVFRSGIIDENNEFHFESPGDFIDVPEIIRRHIYDKKRFLAKLAEMNIKKDVISLVMDQLGENFNYGQLQGAIAETLKNHKLSYTRRKVIQSINWLAKSHYEVTFSLDTALSDRVLFPTSFTEKNGIEDARFVRFRDDDGSITYYATYTAYDGFAILPKLIVTENFYHFQVNPIHGENAQNKGLALFPKRIKGQYAMLSRLDGVNNYVMFSDDITLWNGARKIQEPQYPWEFVQVGNAGSPIETKHGWLVITHGVGPMRTYSLGAMLLDLDDPTKVVARLKEPLLTANKKERDGYVPNVVYSCGALIHNNELIIPYAMSDYSSAIASFPLDELFDELLL
ncbi:MAG: glycoside hydrolase family 130 protein [Phycisphaerae bacterium]|nr:glycoside hydrolase family 130 protein [Phycisphaerae bacterium]